MNAALKTITDNEADQLLERLYEGWITPKQQRNGIRNHLMALLMLDAGLRVGEVVSLLVTSLYIQDEPVHTLQINKNIAKKRAERLVPLTTRIRKAIKIMAEFWWEKDRECMMNPAFFGNDVCKPLTVRQVERIIKDASLSAFGREIHPHILRHTFATRLVATCPTRIVQTLLGHKSLQSTQVYTHPNNSHLKAAIDSIDCEKNGQNSQQT